MSCMQSDLFGFQELGDQRVFEFKQFFDCGIFAVQCEQSCFSERTCYAYDFLFFNEGPVLKECCSAYFSAFSDLFLGEFFSFGLDKEVKNANDCVVAKELHEQGLFFHSYLIEKVV